MQSKFLNIDDSTLNTMLTPAIGKIDIVIDSDTFNEIDDQFAITYAMLSPEKLNVKAIYAAPFLNENSQSPADGMEKSFQEIKRILEKLHLTHKAEILKGSETYIKTEDTPVKSPAALHLAELANNYNAQKPLYVVSIGALSNVISAIMLNPEIINKIVVVWLGGHPYNWNTASEYNLNQDFIASKFLFKSKVPLVHVPCKNVSEKLKASLPDIKVNVKGRGEIGDYLYFIFEKHLLKYSLKTKPIWDMANIAHLVNSNWTQSEIKPRPELKDDKTWNLQNSGTLCRVVTDIKSQFVFEDFFAKLDDFNSRSNLKILDINKKIIKSETVVNNARR
jgi:inosine-uridine nucleoside N-ribohydrolase